ncbi:MAG: hypothetical protein WAM70_20930 [Pyrinomonadaceae bacterium]
MDQSPRIIHTVSSDYISGREAVILALSSQETSQLPTELQRRTNKTTLLSGISDRVQRRDTLFRNLRKSIFLKEFFSGFGADFIIVDFKNYRDEIDSDVIETLVIMRTAL